jgi:hypothetical protein
VVAQNVVNWMIQAGGSCVYENNLVRANLSGFGTALIRNCWAGSLEVANNTPSFIDCVAWTAELTFDGQFLGTGTMDARWQLAADSPVKGQGYGGVDPGQFAGPDPYVLSGLPAVPMVIGLQIPSTASAASGLPVTVDVQVNP